MKALHLLPAALFAATLCSAKEAAPPPDDRPRIQVALLLDTSNSMDGLIDQAKTRLWNLVNQFINAKRDGRAPRLEVALYEYGNDGLPAAGGHVRKILGLTEDLDKISEALFALKTNGGQEYCAWVIGDSLEQLSWSADNRDLKTIFIAGNEPFDQGPKPYAKACEAAVAKGVVVNTIFCGGYQEGADTKWRDGSVLGKGSYSNIDSDKAIVHIPAPQDARIAELNVKLNATYIAYGGRAGEESKMRQEAQDLNAARAAPSVASARIASKSSAQERLRDIVDAAKRGQGRSTKMKEEELPAEMKGMSAGERKAFVEKKTAERAEVQKELRDLGAARDAFVQAETKKRAEAKGGKSLDDAMVESLKAQAVEKGFGF
ncbi:MAG: VWA domain-containing protein [Kiritimatiellia bacterium]